MASLSRTAAAAGAALPAFVRDLAGVGGAGLIIYGAWLVYEPCAYLLAGVFLLAGSILAARGAI